MTCQTKETAEQAPACMMYVGMQGTLLCNQHMPVADHVGRFVAAGRPVRAFAPLRCPSTVYDKFLSSVEQAVRMGQFHRPPLGPIGTFLTLNDPKWALAVELACGRAFGTFITHDFADQKLLKVTICWVADKQNSLCSYQLCQSRSGRPCLLSIICIAASWIVCAVLLCIERQAIHLWKVHCYMAVAIRHVKQPQPWTLNRPC